MGGAGWRQEEDSVCALVCVACWGILLLLCDDDDGVMVVVRGGEGRRRMAGKQGEGQAVLYVRDKCAPCV